MQFPADESCDFAVVRTLRKAGFDVKAVTEVSPGAADEEVIDLATAESRFLLTEDKDFGQLVFASLTGHSGVILIRFPATVRTAIVETVLELIQKHAHNMERRFIVVRPGRIRITDIQG